MEQSSHAAYLRSLQTADDIEGCVGILVHLKEGRRKEIIQYCIFNSSIL